MRHFAHSLAQEIMLTVIFRISNPVRHVPDIQGEAVGLWREHGLETLISESQMKRAAELAEIQHLLNSAQLAQIRDLTTGEREALQQQRSLRFWNDTKSMILTFLCGVTASYTQGFDQSANGNLGIVYSKSRCSRI